VTACAQADGRYGVDLHLIARPVPLHPLAVEVRERIVRTAVAAGLDEKLGDVDLTFESVEPVGPAPASR
jgi:hypothetical protein